MTEETKQVLARAKAALQRAEGLLRAWETGHEPTDTPAARGQVLAAVLEVETLLLREALR